MPNRESTNFSEVVLPETVNRQEGPPGEQLSRPGNAALRGMPLKGVAALAANIYVDRSVKDALLAFFSKPRGGQKKIFCLLAPKGMGKKFVIRAGCEAFGWQLVPIQVGRIQDDKGTVLGNRRADLNALAGRVIHALHGRSARPTVILLENIDRLDATGVFNQSVNFFEILQYIQNYSLKNKYLDRPIDFRHICFAATAANLATIPAGLREQMTVVTLPSYTESEKIHIAKQFILPSLLANQKLEGRLTLSENALVAIIRRYTRETGVAAFSRNLETLCRSARKRIESTGRKQGLRIYRNTLDAYLGTPVFADPDGDHPDEVGAARALGKNERGGCVVNLEILALPGDGKLVCTGNTDKKIQESALVALNHVRSRTGEWGIDRDFYKNTDIHLHLLEGSTPKYGVSAGVTIFTALVSALTGRAVRGDVGMTGEITLHGKIIGVRDIRDKLLAALRVGLQTVFIPRDNELDFRALPAEVKRKLEIVLADRVDVVVQRALVEGK